MPVNAEGFEPNNITAVNLSLKDTNAIHDQIDKAKCEVQNVNSDQSPQITAPRIGGSSYVACDWTDHQGIICCIKFFAF